MNAQHYMQQMISIAGVNRPAQTGGSLLKKQETLRGHKSTGYSYGFRPGNTTGVANTIVKDWNVYPNPAAGQLSVDNPIADGARYEIIDMMGRTLINGCIKAGTQSIDLQALAPGSYVINLYDNDKRAYNKLFVKE